jgi:hypothetical protein
MEGMTDWNKLTMEQYIEHLEEKFKFDSSGTAKAVFELINAYKALTIPVVVKSFYCQTKRCDKTKNKQCDECAIHVVTLSFKKDEL